MVEIDTVDEDILSNFEGDIPARGVRVDSLKLLIELLGFWANTLAVLDVFAKSLSDGSDFLNTRDIVM